MPKYLFVFCILMFFVCALAATTPLSKGSLLNKTTISPEGTRNITTFPWTENFADAPSLPAGWNWMDDGYGAVWQPNEGFSHQNDGSGCMTHARGSQENEDIGWLLTPALDLPANTGMSLSFWSSNNFSEFYGVNQVLVTAGSTDPTDDEYVGIWQPFTVSSGWYQNYVDLSPWAGQTIHIAFRYQGWEAHEWNLDDVRVDEFSGIHDLPFVENFESGVFPPYYWGQFDEDGQNTNWDWNTGDDHTEEGSCFAVHYSGYMPNPEDDWLTTPRIYLPEGSAYFLSFWSLNYYSGLYDENGVYVSTGAVEPSSGQYTQVWSPVSVSETWVQNYVDLSPWAGQSVHIAFRYQGEQYYSQEWRLDDIRVDAYNGITQFPFTEDFESGVFPPYYWTEFDMDGSGTYWSWNMEQPLNHTVGGTCSAMHIWDAEEPSEDGWLVSPQIQVPAGGSFSMSFWSLNINPQWYGYNGVWVSAGSPDPADEYYAEVWNPASVSDTWTYTYIDLTAFSGMNIYVAFRYMGFDAHDWYLDDIEFSTEATDHSPPVITHLPLINTVRDDIPYGVYCEVVDDPVWNNGVDGVWLYYNINNGDWILGYMEEQRAGYYGEIPQVTHGDVVTYVLVASDASPNHNTIYTEGYSFTVDDPVWLHYDDLGEANWVALVGHDWGLGTLYENPLWNTGIPLDILAVSHALTYDDTVTLNIYAADDDSMNNLTPLMAPMELNTIGMQWINVNIIDVQVVSRFFYVSWDGINEGNGFPMDIGTYYPLRNFFIWEGANIDISAGSLSASWMLRVWVGSEEFLAPVLTIINSETGPELRWSEVPEASYYNIWSSLDPSMPDPWDFYDTTDGLGLGLISQDPLRFFKVTAVQEEREFSPSNALCEAQMPAQPSQRSIRVQKISLRPKP